MAKASRDRLKRTHLVNAPLDHATLPLKNWYHERFAQDLARRLCAGEVPSVARPTAYREAFANKPGFDPEGSSLADNARRLANQPNVKARVRQLTHRATVLADTDRAWCVAQLRQRVEGFNLDDYLSGQPGDTGRRFDLDQLTREELGRLSEISVEEEVKGDGEDEELIKLRRIRLKPYDPIATIRLIADLSGAMPPSRHEHAGPGGGPIGLEALVCAAHALPPAGAQPALPAPSGSSHASRQAA